MISGNRSMAKTMTPAAPELQNKCRVGQYYLGEQARAPRHQLHSALVTTGKRTRSLPHPPTRAARVRTLPPGSRYSSLPPTQVTCVVAAPGGTGQPTSDARSSSVTKHPRARSSSHHATTSHYHAVLDCSSPCH